MSNLPHPLGDSNPGDLFYPGTPSVVASDTPGAAGSRAVEFGEDGLSSAVNRAVYALAKNDEYQQERLEEEFARPDMVTFTPAGGSGGNYTFSAKVWCGDAFYTPEDQSMREALISVLDEKYNDLIDPTSGDKIVVKEILDAPAGASQVGSGFITNPYITFRRVHPVTGALGADYTIPDGTKVWLAFGRAAVLDSMVGDTNVRDSWFRGFTRSVGEIHAASFLRDGSRKALGSFDMDGNDLDNVVNVTGVPGTHLTLGASGVADLQLYSEGYVVFRDQFLGGYLPLNEDETSLLGLHTSILSSLNSKTAVSAAFFGNRCANRNGVLTFTDGTGTISWPDLDVIISGERIVVSSGGLVATNNPAATYVLVVDNTGFVTERAENAVLSTDIPLTSHTWNGAAFTKKKDIRWMHNSTSRHLEITCGDVSDTCDFDRTQLDLAVELANVLSASVAAQLTHLPIIRIVGQTFVLTSPYKITLRAPTVILGIGVDQSVIFSDLTNGHTVDLFDCAGHRLVLKDLTVAHAGTAHGSTLAAVLNAGDRSVFDNLKFTYSAPNDRGFANVFKWTQVAGKIRIQDVVADYVGNSFIFGSDATFNTGYLQNSNIKNCWVSWDPVPVGLIPYGLIVNGGGNSVENVWISAGLSDYGLVTGFDTLVDHCTVDMLGAGGATPSGILHLPLTSSVEGSGLKVRNCFFLRIPGSGITTQSPLVGAPSIIMHMAVSGTGFTSVEKPFTLDGHSAFFSSSSVHVHDCTIYDTTDYIASVDNLSHFRFLNNVCASISGDGIVIGTNAGGEIVGNFIEGYGAAGSNSNSIEVSLGSPIVEVIGNILQSTGAPINSSQVRAWRRITFTDNVLIGGEVSGQVGVTLTGLADNSTIEGNLLGNHKWGGIHADALSNGCRIEGNAFFDEDRWGIWIDEVTDTIISGNAFVGGLAGFAGLGILVTGTGVDAGAGTKILGNYFRGVEGIGNGTWYGCIYITGTVEGSVPDCEVAYNRIFDCGSTSAVLLNNFWAGIYSSGIRTSVHGNHVRVLKGPAGNSTAVGIRIDYEPTSETSCSQIIGNTVRHNLSDEQGPNFMFGIHVTGNSTDIHSIVSMNTIDFRNTSGAPVGGAGKTTIGLYAQLGDAVVAMGNIIPSWTHAGATNYGVDMTFGTSSYVIGNVTGTTGVPMTNNIGAGVLPSTGAYNGSALTPRGDFNIGTSF